MKKFSQLALLIITTSLLAHNAQAQDQNFHIYLCFGQSNMEGQGTVEAQDRVTNNRVKVLQDQTCSNLNRVYGQWYTAAPPLNRCFGKLGPADYFGKAMADNSSSAITIGIVNASVSGCDIALYQKSAPIGRAGADIPTQFNGGYAWLLDLARKAKTVGVIKGIIFHQGETNTNDPNWKFKVQQIVNDLRTDLGIGNVPFLAGELLYAQFGSCCSSHNTEVNKLPGIIPNAFVISASGLPGADVAHFTSASYRELGRRYAQKMLTLVGSTPPPPPANTPPTVSISAPANNASFAAPASITITANAADANGSVTNVQFFNGSTLLGSDASAPYSFTWPNVAAGTYTITARATDNAGAMTTSGTIAITVTNGAPPPPPPPPTGTGDIIGADCGANNTSITYELNATRRANVTSYTWWYTGSAASTTIVSGIPYRAVVQTGINFSAGQICVGVNLSVAPWYTSYCKAVSKCATVTASNKLPLAE